MAKVQLDTKNFISDPEVIVQALRDGAWEKATLTLQYIADEIEAALKKQGK